MAVPTALSRVGGRPSGRSPALVAVLAVAVAVAMATIELTLDVRALLPCPAAGCSGVDALDFGSQVVLAAAWLVAGAVILLRASPGRAPALLAVALFAQAANALAYPALNGTFAGRLVTGVALVLAVTAIAVFPNGWVAPWLRWVVAAYAVFTGAALALPDGTATEWVVGAAMFLAMGAAIVAQVVRYRRGRSPEERDQIAWFVLGLSLAFGVMVVLSLPYFVPAWSDGPVAPDSAYDRFATITTTLALVAIPVSITVAVVRARLFDVHVVIGRTIVYAMLSALVATTYLVVVGVGALLGDRTGRVSPLVGAAVVALAFQPVRSRLQGWVRRRLYGLRAEPYAAMSRLVHRLGETGSDQDMLQELVETIRRSLQVPYVGVRIRYAGREGPAAESGEPGGQQLSLPLVHHGEEIGSLEVGALRADGLATKDRALLEDLAAQAGPVVQGVRLAAELRASAEELQASRERLVTAREEERLRLRRNLHDELAPTLAAAGLTAATASALVDRDPAEAGRVLARLEGSLADAVESIRRLAHELRPPVLDEHGLVGSLCEHARDLPPSLQVHVEADPPLPPLPAATEVAAYRICLEGLRNAVRHAHAGAVDVRLTADDVWLRLSIEDDGRGIAPTATPGLGLRSMRERAAELGGRTTMGPRSGGGTRVSVQLPLHPRSDDA